MNAMFSPQSHTSKTPQLGLPQRGEHYPTLTELESEQPKVLITGDIRLYVPESEALLQPIIGRYSIETTGMQEPLYLLWHAEGQVQSHQARSTAIAFDMSGARAGETYTYLVAVQVTEPGIRGRVVQSCVFVQIVVTSDDLPATLRKWHS